jgi:hypothetical protein
VAHLKGIKMELDAVSKYITLNRLPNNTVEVLFAGQPCLSVTETDSTTMWKINPVFAKLVYGANIFSDIPVCTELGETTEGAIAAGLSQLYALGAFKTAVDLPEDSYAATMSAVSEDIKKYAREKTNNIFEASALHTKLMGEFETDMFALVEGRSEWAANDALRTQSTKIVKPSDSTPAKRKFHLNSSDGRRMSSHDTEGDAMRAFKGLSDTRGVKIVHESDGGDVEIAPMKMFSEWKADKTVSEQDGAYSPVKRKFVVHYKNDKGETKKANREAFSPRSLKRMFDGDGTTLIDIKHNGKSVLDESVDDEYSNWENEVKKTHPTKKLKFKGRIENGADTISAEEPNVDRSYGVWDNNKNKGHVFKVDEEAIEEKALTEPEKVKREEIVTALKADPKFMSKYGKSSAFAIATAQAKESA